MTCQFGRAHAYFATVLRLNTLWRFVPLLQLSPALGSESSAISDTIGSRQLNFRRRNVLARSGRSLVAFGGKPRLAKQQYLVKATSASACLQSD